MDFAFVAMFEGRPVAVAHTRKDMEMLLAKYTGGTLVEYKAYYSKYPSDYEGSYFYSEGNTDEIVEFKVYSVDYLWEDNEKNKLEHAFRAGWMRANAMNYKDSYFQYYWENDYTNDTERKSSTTLPNFHANKLQDGRPF